MLMLKKSPYNLNNLTAIALTGLFLLMCHGRGYADSKTVKIGVYAIQSAPACREKWEPLEDLLNSSLPEYRFEIIPLSFNDAITAMRIGSVDLLIANPTLFVYVSLEDERIFRVATLAPLNPQGKPFARKGGVLFCKAPHKGRPRLTDFRAKAVMAEHEHSFGGWLAVSREIQKKYDLSADKFFTTVHFAGRPEAVIKAVDAGITDIGMVRTGVFESMSKAGKISLDDYHFFAFSDEISPYICSTQLYPEWVMCSQGYMSDGRVKEILNVLWRMPQDSPLQKSAGVAQFHLPLDYHLTRLCMRDLRIGPYRNFQRRFAPTERMFWVWYWKWIVTFVLFLILLLISLLSVLRLNHRLVKARDEAFAADHAKSDFLANMCHEIRTPLNAVLGLSNLLMEPELNAHQVDYAKTIHSSSEALLTIINDILDISKIDANKLALESVEFDLRECIESSLEVVAPGAQGKGLTLISDFDPDMPATVLSDNSRLRQVLLNLLSNAVKFTEKGEITVKTVTEKKEGGICTMAFHIRDSGIGMTKEQMTRIFAPFDQADTSTSRRFGGTGLGLSISRKIVTLMGGNLSVDSKPGKGSDFIVTMPMVMGPGSAELYLQSNLPALQDHRALIIDPNWPRTESMAAQLEFWGMTVFAADSKTKAIDIVETEKPFNVILIDAQLAGLYGDELCQVFRAIPQSMNVPMVLLTYKGVDNAGSYDEIIHKPVRLRRLFERLVAIVGADIEHQVETAEEEKEDLLGQEGDKSIRILLVDDLLVNLKVAQKMCTRLGYEQIDAVASGQDALEAVMQKRYDVILMDVQMPEMDGLEATRCILKMCPEGMKPAIVGMTANALMEDREKCYQAGMSDYVAKPVQLKKLSEALLKIKRSD